MIIQELFQQALNITEPWYIKDLQFDNENKRLDIYIDFKRGSSFSFKLMKDDKGTEIIDNLKAYDTKEKTWRHLNFFEYLYSFPICSENIKKILLDDKDVALLYQIVYRFLKLQDIANG